MSLVLYMHCIAHTHLNEGRAQWSPPSGRVTTRDLSLDMLVLATCE